MSRSETINLDRPCNLITSLKYKRATLDASEALRHDKKWTIFKNLSTGDKQWRIQVSILFRILCYDTRTILSYDSRNISLQTGLVELIFHSFNDAGQGYYPRPV